MVDNKQKNISAAQKVTCNKHIDKSFRKKAEPKEQKQGEDTTRKIVSWSGIQQIGN